MSLHSFLLSSCQGDRLGHLACLLVVLFLVAGARPSLGAQSGEHGLAPRAPLGMVWEVPLAEGSAYTKELEAGLSAYEAEVGQKLAPGERGRVGLKINTRSGHGLSTPRHLLRAVIEALEERGFERDAILIVDYSAHSLREAGVMPPRSRIAARFEGCPVQALDSGKFYDEDWFYDSPLPPARQQGPGLNSAGSRSAKLEVGDRGRKSLLPVQLLFEVDFWFNLAVGVDDPALGIDGALANATLWNVSNSQRFLVNQASASAAVAEIAAIPELEERLVLNFVSLERYQFIAGPFFNSIYTRSEPRLWVSSDPVALDRLLYDRMNAMRVLEGFPEIQPLPRQLSFAASLGIGVYDRERIHIQPIELPAERAREKPQARMEPALVPALPPREEPWLQRVTSW